MEPRDHFSQQDPRAAAVAHSRNPSFLLLAYLVIVAPLPTLAQLEVASEFNPAEIGSICALAVDPSTNELWVYSCSNSEIHRYSKAGTLIDTLPVPDGTANDVDIDFTSGALVLDDTLLPGNTALFFDGEVEETDVFAMTAGGAVIATLNTDYGFYHVVGGAHHPSRGTLFLLQDNVPGVLGNRVAEINPTSGAVIDDFSIAAVFDVFYGDIEVCPSTGNLLLVSSIEDSIAELSPDDGSLVSYHSLPEDVSSLSGIAVEVEAERIWVSAQNGIVFELSGGAFCPPFLFADGFESGDTSAWSATVD